VSNKSKQEEDGNHQEELTEVEKSHWKQDPAPTLVEWSIRIFSLITVIGVLAYLTWSSFQLKLKPDIKFTAEKDKIELRSQGWMVPVEVQNTGSRNIQMLNAEALLSSKETLDGQSEKCPMNIALLGCGEIVKMEVTFQKKPNVDNLSFEVKSYILP